MDEFGLLTLKPTCVNFLISRPLGRLHLSHPIVTFHFWSSFVALLFRDMRDLFSFPVSGRFTPTSAVVIFYSCDSSVASLFCGMRDLLTSDASGRFTPVSAVVIFRLRNGSVAFLFQNMRDLASFFRHVGFFDSWCHLLRVIRYRKKSTASFRVLKPGATDCNPGYNSGCNSG